MNNRRGFLERAGFGLAGVPLLRGAAAPPDWRTRKQRFNMSGFAAPKLDKVRLGIIGLGHRGPSHLRTLLRIEGIEVRALCDLRPERVEAARKMLDGTPHKPQLYSGSAEQWKRMCEQPDLDLVYITTPYYMHSDMAVFAMEHGKHAASEVPIAATMEQCWNVVLTAERTRALHDA